ncbi:MAG: hypothetical protein V4450_17720 [Bacteroidota bacterium]
MAGFFFNSILLHNLIFPNTAYSLVGFTKEEGILYAFMKQLFITSDGQAELDNSKKLSAYNGFENKRRNDYFNKELGLIWEDMHGENVLVNSTRCFY